MTTTAAPARAPRITVPTAIVHDWFQGFHGSERVVDAMRTELFGDGVEPDIYTFHAARELLDPALADAIVRESRVTRLPFVRQRGHDPGLWRNLLPYMPYYFRRLDLDQYDLVISSSHAFAAGVRPRRDAIHVVYCHTPIRYVWLTDADRRVGGARGVALGGLRTWLRRQDLAASRRPDTYVANSTAVQERIRRFYGRDSIVVPPPVDVDDFDPDTPTDEGRFLWVHRLVSYKRPELVAEAFRGLPYRLTMVGVGPLEPRVRRALPPNVELLPWVERRELVRLFERATGFIHAAEEDFGISMVEALAAGTPVIGLARGGAIDIVRNGVDGVLMSEASVEALRRAVDDVARTTWDRRALRARAETFSRDAFGDRMRAVIAAAAR